MKKFIFYFLAIFFLWSCKSNPLEDHLNEADAVVVRFYDANVADSITKIIKTTDENAIAKLSSLADDKEIENIKCNNSGTLIFMKNEKELQKVDFNYNNDCRYFSLNFNGKQTLIKMNNERADFLKALEQGKNFY